MSMIFVDTNYFLRFLLKDDSLQHTKVTELFMSAARGEVALCTSVVVFFEMFWVLTRVYEKPKNEVVVILTKVLKLSFIEFDERFLMQKALSLYKKGTIELEDYYNIAFAEFKNADTFASFDKKLQKTLSYNTPKHRKIV